MASVAASSSVAGGLGARVPEAKSQKLKKKKILLMGKSGSGKSSMRSIIFSNYLAKDTRRLGATIDIDLSHVKFLGNLQLNLWDCGGQEAFMENYLSQQRQHVFNHVGVMIYVFDIESRDVDRDMATYVTILSGLMQYSPSAKIFVLIHKMDLIPNQTKEAVFVERVALIRQRTAEYIASAGVVLPQPHHPPGSGGPDLTPFATSIWDQSLYKAWSEIIHDLIPSLSLIEEHLEKLGRLIQAEEIQLFERTSFLVVSSWVSEIGSMNPFQDRQERLSNILKAYKSSLSKYTGTPRNSEQFKDFELKVGTRFSLFITKFTTNTYILCCLPPGEALYNSAKMNVKIAARLFEGLDNPAAASAATPKAPITAAAGPGAGGHPESSAAGAVGAEA
ncbi:GTP-binding protein GTR1 [Magnaporthiopsis poae ATCC 64411]|uniref:GTP-binding protein n=1 Tax=Magnaporthiopsis poae (strain ATCC 64411 / 73-15) TaxID=644358 RepID=A0A0C4DVN6_MAGP6|nr:GTP-binding protein GTR1 [Magnaporthiopsis poae ATCC 64411]